ncbi:hypothetical protein BN871_BS_00240 [Paenibacillus sp. P22]|nr:hypothetical protein BN871_BS_00240 [Paenibacillus sp. P22]
MRQDRAPRHRREQRHGLARGRHGLVPAGGRRCTGQIRPAGRHRRPQALARLHRPQRNGRRCLLAVLLPRLKVGKVAQVGPVDKLSVVLAIVIAVLFLGEKLTLWNGVGVVLIAAGAILTSLK